MHGNEDDFCSLRIPLKDLLNYYISLWDIIPHLRDYWIIMNDHFQWIDTTDKHKVSALHLKRIW